MIKTKSMMLLLGIVVLTAIVFFVGIDDIKIAFRSISLFSMAILFFLQIATMIVISYQWYFLLRKKSKSVKFRDVFAVYLSGNFIESVTPSVRLGGEAMKVYLFRQIAGLSYDNITGLLVVRKYISLLPFLILCGISLVISMYLIELPVMIYVAFSVLILLFVLLYRLWITLGKQYGEENTGLANGHMVPSEPSLYRSISAGKAKVLNFLQKASSSSGGLISKGERNYLMLLSLLVWGLYPVKIYFVGWALGFNITGISAVLGTYTAYLIGMLPLFPGGLGTFESSMAIVFTHFGLSPGEGLSIALIARFATFWFPLMLSAIGSWFMLKKTDLFRFVEVKKGCAAK